MCVDNLSHRCLRQWHIQAWIFWIRKLGYKNELLPALWFFKLQLGPSLVQQSFLSSLIVLLSTCPRWLSQTHSFSSIQHEYTQPELLVDDFTSSFSETVKEPSKQLLIPPSSSLFLCLISELSFFCPRLIYLCPLLLFALLCSILHLPSLSSSGCFPSTLSFHLEPRFWKGLSTGIASICSHFHLFISKLTTFFSPHGHLYITCCKTHGFFLSSYLNSLKHSKLLGSFPYWLSSLDFYGTHSFLYNFSQVLLHFPLKCWGFSESSPLTLFLNSNFSHWDVNLCGRDLICHFTDYFTHTTVLKHTKCWIYLCWINEWMNNWMDGSKEKNACFWIHLSLRSSLTPGGSPYKDGQKEHWYLHSK